MPTVIEPRAVTAGLLLLLLAAWGASGHAEPVAAQGGDVVVLEATRITGNEELPKVLYVLPWREVPASPPAARAPGMPAAAHAQPINPVTHARHLQIYQRLTEENSP